MTRWSTLQWNNFENVLYCSGYRGRVLQTPRYIPGCSVVWSCRICSVDHESQSDCRVDQQQHRVLSIRVRSHELHWQGERCHWPITAQYLIILTNDRWAMVWQWWSSSTSSPVSSVVTCASGTSEMSCSTQWGALLWWVYSSWQHCHHWEWGGGGGRGGRSRCGLRRCWD